MKLKEVLKPYRKIILVLALGIGYYLLTQFTPIRIPCPVKTVTGLACPGCGITHYFIALFHGDLRLAFHENAVLFILLPLWAMVILVQTFIRPRWLKRGSTLETVLLYAAIVILLLFGIVRNLPGCAFLLPVYGNV